MSTITEAKPWRCLNCKTKAGETQEKCTKCGDRLRSSAPPAPVRPGRTTNTAAGRKNSGTQAGPSATTPAPRPADDSPINPAPCGTPGATFRHSKVSDMPTRAGRSRMRNKYAGSCVICGRWVPAETGCIEKNNGRWTVLC